VCLNGRGGAWVKAWPNGWSESMHEQMRGWSIFAKYCQPYGQHCSFLLVNLLATEKIFNYSLAVIITGDRSAIWSMHGYFYSYLLLMFMEFMRMITVRFITLFLHLWFVAVRIFFKFHTCCDTGPLLTPCRLCYIVYKVITEISLYFAGVLIVHHGSIYRKIHLRK
jgi:hypothetical protein